jgi:thiosulfate/3-mercaptopyruvate sulfurtransferase
LPAANRYNAYIMHGPLIDPRTLARHLDDADWIVVDCRFNLMEPNAGRTAYEHAHVPGARYADLDRDLARSPSPAEGRHPLPAPATFAAKLGEWGIGRDAAVVAYDDGSSAIAARLWWLLGWMGHERRFVLDGGWAGWQQAGLPLEQDAPTPWQPRQYEWKRDGGHPVVATNEIEAGLRAGQVLVDVRAAVRYRGEQEPIDPVAGHVPGAVSRPFSDNVTATGRFRPAEDLKRELTALLAGREPHDLIAMCGSGVTACHLLLAMEVAGLPGGKLYAGSWSEWIRDPARPVRRGAEP